MQSNMSYQTLLPGIDALGQRIAVIDLDDASVDEDDQHMNEQEDHLTNEEDAGCTTSPPRFESKDDEGESGESNPPLLVLSEERFTFYDSFETLVWLEFRHREIDIQDALQAMWIAHEWKFGPHCNEECSCFNDLDELAEQMYYYHYVEEERTRSMNFLSCFLPKFLGVLSREYPHESRKDLGYRIQRMWALHGMVSTEMYLRSLCFHMPCSMETCRCADYWDTLFNRGDCSTSCAVSICDQMDAIREFQNKFRPFVQAEFGITGFPDAINFALGRLWQRHLDQFGEICNGLCPCWTALPDMSETILGEMLQRQEKSSWTNPLQFKADSVPSGVLLCYARNEAFGAALQARFHDEQALPKYIAAAVNGCGPGRLTCRCKRRLIDTNEICPVFDNLFLGV